MKGTNGKGTNYVTDEVQMGNCAAFDYNEHTNYFVVHHKSRVASVKLLRGKGREQNNAKNLTALPFFVETKRTVYIHKNQNQKYTPLATRKRKHEQTNKISNK